MEYSLIPIKSHLHRKITHDVNSAFTEYLNSITNMLTKKTIITMEYMEEKSNSIEKHFENQIAENVRDWFDYISEELINKQIVNQAHPNYEEISNIVRAEYIHYISMDALYSEIENEKKQVKYFNYASNVLNNVSFQTNPQYRVDIIKTITYEYKVCFLKVVCKRIDDMLEKIQDLCNNDT